MFPYETYNRYWTYWYNEVTAEGRKCTDAEQRLIDVYTSISPVAALENNLRRMEGVTANVDLWDEYVEMRKNILDGLDVGNADEKTRGIHAKIEFHVANEKNIIKEYLDSNSKSTFACVLGKFSTPFRRASRSRPAYGETIPGEEVNASGISFKSLGKGLRLKLNALFARPFRKLFNLFSNDSDMRPAQMQSAKSDVKSGYRTDPPVCDFSNFRM